MKSTKLLLLTRKELPNYKSDCLFEDINIASFPSYYKEIETHTVTMFVDTNLDTKIINNRYGNNGIVS